MQITPEISAKLLELKHSSGLTFEQIGAEVGTSDANARRYIMGETKVPDRQLLYAIVRCLGGDPEEIFAQKPTVQNSAFAGMDPAFYDKLTANFEARYARQQQLHEESLNKWHEKHEKEVVSLRATFEQTIRSKDQWIEKLKGDIEATSRKCSRMTILAVCLATVAVLLVAIYLIPDLLNGDWGHIRY